MSDLGVNTLLLAILCWQMRQLIPLNRSLLALFAGLAAPPESPDATNVQHITPRWWRRRLEKP